MLNDSPSHICGFALRFSLNTYRFQSQSEWLLRDCGVTLLGVTPSVLLPFPESIRMTTPRLRSDSPRSNSGASDSTQSNSVTIDSTRSYSNSCSASINGISLIRNSIRGQEFILPTDFKKCIFLLGYNSMVTADLCLRLLQPSTRQT